MKSQLIMLSTALMLSLLLLDHVRRANAQGSNDTSPDDTGGPGNSDNGHNASTKVPGGGNNNATPGRLEH